MAGSLTLSTLNDSSGVLSTQNGMSGICKAWVNFGGGVTYTAGSIRASFNVSSITVNGTADYTINFTTAMPDANYSLVGTNKKGTGQSNQSGPTVVQGYYNQLYTTSSARIIMVDAAAGSPYASETVSVAVFR